MRITKKFAGPSCIGKQIYQPADRSNLSQVDLSKLVNEIKECELELSQLERSYFIRQSGGGGGGGSTDTKVVKMGSTKDMKLSPNRLSLTPATTNSGLSSIRLKVDTNADYSYSFSPTCDNDASRNEDENGHQSLEYNHNKDNNNSNSNSNKNDNNQPVTSITFLQMQNQVKSMRRSISAPELAHLASSSHGITDGNDVTQSGGRYHSQPFSELGQGTGKESLYPAFNLYGPTGASSSMLELPMLSYTNGNVASGVLKGDLNRRSLSSPIYAMKGIHKGRKRCQSVLDLMEFESSYQTDSSAGDLLFNFFRSLHSRSSNKKQSTENSHDTNQVMKSSISESVVESKSEDVKNETLGLYSSANSSSSSNTSSDDNNDNNIAITTATAAQCPSPDQPSIETDSLIDSPSYSFQLGIRLVDQVNQTTSQVTDIVGTGVDASVMRSDTVTGAIDTKTSETETSGDSGIRNHPRAYSDTTSAYTHSSSGATSREDILLYKDTSFQEESVVCKDAKNQS